MGKIRAFSPHIRWSDQEVAVLRLHYATAPLDQLEQMLPGRHRRMIQCQANGLGLVRARLPKRTPDQVREAKRLQMASRREADPEAARAYSRSYHHANRKAQLEKMRAYQSRRFFWSRAKKCLGSTVHAKQLAALWKAQRGLCALTGRRLDRSAQIDHKIPRAKGGKDEIANLRWVCPEINYAKRDMSDEQLLAMCVDCMAWIGRRIAQVDAISVQEQDA